MPVRSTIFKQIQAKNDILGETLNEASTLNLWLSEKLVFLNVKIKSGNVWDWNHLQKGRLVNNHPETTCGPLRITTRCSCWGFLFEEHHLECCDFSKSNKRVVVNNMCASLLLYAIASCKKEASFSMLVNVEEHCNTIYFASLSNVKLALDWRGELFVSGSC